jgi:predicted NodU family carbamoyl transferase
MNILGINISHDTSIGQIKNDKIEIYQEEKDSLNLDKFTFTFPLDEKIRLKCIDDYIKEEPDFVIYTSYDRSHLDGTNYEDIAIIEKLQKQLNNPNFLFFKKNHHVYHAFNSFHLSNFDEALCIVLDGGGSQILPSFQEIESIYYLNKNHYICYYQHLTNNRFANEETLLNDRVYNIVNAIDIELSSELSSGMKFANFVGLMKRIKKYDDAVSMKTIIREMMNLYYVGNENGNKLEDAIKRLHIETRKDTIKIIQKALKYKNTKNIILSGGYALNTINNQEYTKYFSDHNFFFDPWAHDGGTAPGAALWLNFQFNRNNKSFKELLEKQNEYIVNCL